MKTAISIDDRVYRSAEDAIGQMGLTRSRLYTLAIEEYIQNHSPDVLLKRLNEVYTKENSKLDEDIQQAQFDLFSGEDW
ncbi:transcriptional regulator [Spirochaetia bacterium]|nr:transcriptional regulator [Spirochaetia bacterium]